MRPEGLVQQFEKFAFANNPNSLARSAQFFRFSVFAAFRMAVRKAEILIAHNEKSRFC